MKNKFLTVISVLAVITVNAQSGMDAVLSAVAKNNKTIVTGNKYWESQKLMYKTGLTPADPDISFDYMKGSPVGAGNQVDMTATQSFDFPTVYADKKNLAKAQIGQSDFQMSALRQDILLETKLVCMDLILMNKENAILNVRKKHAEKIVNDYELKMKSGDGNVIEMNKAKINLINIQNELRINNGQIKSLSQKLIQLNGGVEIQFMDTIYPMNAEITSFDELEKNYEMVDPVLKNLEQQTKISNEQVSLSKSMWLPKFETGYHYQAILGQTFNGVHFGVTIPLWQNKNTVRQKEAEVLFSQTQVEEHKTEHFFEIKQLYEKYIALKASYDEYLQFMASLTSVALLEKALKAGEISTLEYFGELSAYYDTLDNLLKTENEYHKVIAELNKYLL